MQSLVTSSEIRKSAHAKLAWALPLLVAMALGVGFVNLYLLPAVAAFVCLICLAIAFPERMFLFALACSILVSVEIGVKLGALPRIGPSLTVLAALLLGAVLHCGSRFDREQIAAIFAQVPMIRLWIVYIVFLLASAALSINRQASYYSATKEILLQFALVLLLSYFLRDPRFWPRLRTVLFLATAFACFYAVAEEITHYNIFLSFYPTEELVMRGDILRVRSTFFHPIAFGTYLALIYPFLVVDVVKRRSSHLYGLARSSSAGYVSNCQPWSVALADHRDGIPCILAGGAQIPSDWSGNLDRRHAYVLRRCPE